MAHIQPDIHEPKIPQISIWTANISQGGGNVSINQLYHNTTGATLELTPDGTGIINIQSDIPLFTNTPIRNWLIFINNQGGNGCTPTMGFVDESNLKIYQYAKLTNVLTDDLLANCILEIRIYNYLN